MPVPDVARFLEQLIVSVADVVFDAASRRSATTCADIGDVHVLVERLPKLRNLAVGEKRVSAIDEAGRGKKLVDAMTEFQLEHRSS